jgi:general nucleoside transport system permease protein
VVNRARGLARVSGGKAPGIAPLGEAVLAIAVAMAIGAVVLWGTGHDPVQAYRELVSRTLGRPIGLQEIAVRATPLLIAAIAVVLAAKAGLWNIGIDGQVLIGALAAAEVGHRLLDFPRAVVWICAIGAAALGGAAWIAVPALLRARWGISEIVTTIMFNYTALSLTSWLVKGPLADPALVAPQTPSIPRELRFSTLGETRAHLGGVWALGLLLAVAFVLYRTRRGFEIRVVGQSPAAARHAMIPVVLTMTAVLIVSGAIAGIAGANDVLSTKGTFQAEWNPGYGLSGFALVFLARQSLAGMIPAALFLGMLSYGGDVMPRAADVPSAFFTLLEGLLLVMLACAQILRRRKRDNAR